MIQETFNRLKTENPDVPDAIIRQTIGQTLAKTIELGGIYLLRNLWDVRYYADFVDDRNIMSTLPDDMYTEFVDKYYAPHFKNGTAKLRALVRIVKVLLTHVMQNEYEYQGQHLTVDMLLDDNRLGKLSLITRFFTDKPIEFQGFNTLEELRSHLLCQAYDKNITYDYLQAEVQKILGKLSKKRILIEELYEDNELCAIIIKSNQLKDVYDDLSRKYDITYL